MYRIFIKPTLILAAIAFAASFALSHVNKITRGKIEERARQQKEDALKAVLPPYLGYTIVEKNRKATVEGIEFFYSIAQKNEGEKILKAYVFECENPGYSGIVRSIVAVDEKLTLLGMSVIQQAETPGLGARSKEMASNKTFFEVFFGLSRKAASDKEAVSQSWFEAQFTGLDAGKKIGIIKKGEWSAENAALRQELIDHNAVSAITGATITTKAVILSIEKGIAALKHVLEQENNAPGEAASP